MSGALDLVTRNCVTADAGLRVAPDARADGGRRRVSFDAVRVLIERSYSGIAMHVGVPAASYRGVALSLDVLPNGVRTYKILLAHRDSDLSIVLADSSQEDSVADWKHWARYFSLPLLVQRHDGGFDTVNDMLGAVELGRSQSPRRRGGWIAKRRPRFLARRRMGRAIEKSICHFGEREIICYE